MSRAKRRQRIRRWLFAGVVGIVGLLVIIGLALPSLPVFNRPTGRTDVVKGVGKTVPDIGADHIPIGQRFTAYNSTPPTSGPHWGQPAGPAKCGIHDSELPDEAVVHNLEHGHVAISHNLKNPEEIAKLKKLVGELSGWGLWGILHPYSKLNEGEIAITAWTVIDKFQGIDEARIRKFWEVYAPNRFSVEAQQAGPIPCS